MKRIFSQNLRKNVVFLLCAALSFSSSVSAIRTLNLRHNLKIWEDLEVLGEFRVINLTGINEDSPIVCTSDFIIDPCQKLLVKKIEAVSKDVEGEAVTYEADSCGTVSIYSNAAINPDRELSVNKITPVKERCDWACSDDEVFTSNDCPNAKIKLDGNIQIKDKRIIGQTPSMCFPKDYTRRVLCVSFDDWSDCQHESDIGTGAYVDLQFHGIARGHNYEESTEYFDVFAKASVFVGPGNSFENTVVSCPEIYYGHQFGHTISGLDISFYRNSTRPGKVWIEIKVPCSYSEWFTLDSVEASIFYDITSTNIDKVSVEVEAP